MYLPQLKLFLQHLYFLLQMSDSIINLASGFDGDSPSTATIGTFPNLHLLPFAHGRMEPTVIPLFDGSNSKRAYVNSLEE